jgi:hypothetical protein
VWWLLACDGAADPKTDTAQASDTDTDADADADADVDTDADSDTDVDTRATAETGTSGDTGCSPTTTTTVPVPLAGFGTISGACGVLDSCDWGASAPLLFRNTVDFGLTAFDAGLLSADGQEVISDGNLGGDSVESEAIAVDVAGRCELSALLKTEGEIVYLDVAGKKTDELLEIDGRKIGVSVTRALTFVTPDDLCGVPDPTAMEDLLVDKLSDLPLSAANADPVDAWERSALAILACDPAHGDAIEAAWATLDPAVKGDAIVLLTVTEGEDDFIY